MKYFILFYSDSTAHSITEKMISLEKQQKYPCELIYLEPQHQKNRNLGDGNINRKKNKLMVHFNITRL